MSNQVRLFRMDTTLSRDSLIALVEDAVKRLEKRQAENRHGYTCDLLMYSRECSGLSMYETDIVLDAYGRFTCHNGAPVWWNSYEFYHDYRKAGLRAFLQHIKELPSVD